jgi:preprotein translocase subunit SecE
MVSYVKAESPKLLDKLLWGFIFAIVIASIGGNYYFVQYSQLMRTMGLLVGIAIAVGIASRTVLGQKIWQLWLESLQEVRKIYWPSRKETIQTTVAVLVMVCVMGMLLWTADYILLRAVKWLTGHWGV